MNFSVNVKSLVRLTKKFTKFEWSKECQSALDFLKESLTMLPVLAFPDTSQSYILYASYDCTRACLSQEQNTQEEMKSNKKNEKPIH